MAFSFFQKQNDKSLTLLVDIGSASVGVALADILPGKAPRIFFTTREDIPFQKELSSAKFLLAMGHTLEHTLKTAQSKIKGRSTPAHIFCTLSSPWFMLKTRHIAISEEKEFMVTEKIINSFFEQDMVRMREDFKGVLPGEDIAVIERKIINTKFNGYDIKNPHGQKTSHIEMVATVGISSKKVINDIQTRISRLFHAESLHFGSFPVAAFSAVRDIFPQENNFLFLDITGEATDVSLVTNDVLVGSVSFPRGKNFFVREISAGLKTPHEAAITLLNMFLHDMLDTKKKAVVSQIIEAGKTEWFRRFEKAIITLAKEGALSQKVFFSSDSDVADFFTTVLAEAKLSSTSHVLFTPSYLDQQIVSKFVTCDTEVIRDPFLMIEALLVGKINIQK